MQKSLQQVLRFEVRTPGTEEPTQRFTQRWMAEREVRRLEEEHGFSTVVQEVMVPAAPNPWGERRESLLRRGGSGFAVIH